MAPRHFDQAAESCQRSYYKDESLNKGTEVNIKWYTLLDCTFINNTEDYLNNFTAFMRFDIKCLS